MLRRRWLSLVGGFSVQDYLGRNTVNDLPRIGAQCPFLPEAGGVIERQSCFFLASRCRAQSLLAISSTSCGRKSSPVSCRISG
jgi:hypothetical protein